MKNQRNPNHFRQGDVGIAKLVSIDVLNLDRISIVALNQMKLKKCKPNNFRLILAYGEATGHHHSVSLLEHPEAELFDIENIPGALLLRIKSPLKVDHQEHKKIDLIDPGDYFIDHQREYDPESLARERRVQD